MIENIFSEFERRSLRVEIIGGSLKLTPSDRIDDELRRLVKGSMPDILARLASDGDGDIEWRLAAFLRQLQPLHPPATVPTLFASDAEPKHREDCASCAELLDADDWLICGPCARAKAIALDLWLARPSQIVRAA